MLAPRYTRLLPLVGGLLVLLFLVYGYRDLDSIADRFSGNSVFKDVSPPQTSTESPSSTVAGTTVATTSYSPTPTPEPTQDKVEETKGKTEEIIHYEPEKYREIFSVSRADKKFFPIKFAHKKGINPNIIPHPHFNDTWIVVAMQHDPSPLMTSVWFVELVCLATFKDDALSCTAPPQILPIAATSGPIELCQPKLNWFSLNIGPHDARVFYGPNHPYTIYGSNSEVTCFGQWIQDFRLLMDWGAEEIPKHKYFRATEIQRPKPIGMVEKNYFLFWEKDENSSVYAHYDIYPKRAFAKLEYNGTAGPDLAPNAAANDEKCMAAYMPKVAEKLESIHQATNSLKITLCKRADPACKPDDSNTYFFTIFQHKSYYEMHSVYEPYIMLFKQAAPFEIHAISTKPLWISGRGTPGQWKKPSTSYINDKAVRTQTQMLYVTSMSWKQKGQKYHGYIDDIIFLAFGVEDADTGGIDVLAGDLLQDLGLCANT